MVRSVGHPTLVRGGSRGGLSPETNWEPSRVHGPSLAGTLVRGPDFETSGATGVEDVCCGGRLVSV